MKFKIRDRRDRGWFWVDNDYLNGFAKYFGANGAAIYFSLCRHANARQKCFPSQKFIAEELGISERTVRKYLGLFSKYHLVETERERHSKTHKWLNNVYILTDKSEWIKPEATVASGARGKFRHEPEANNDKSQRQLLPTKKTNIKNTHIKNTENLKIEKKEDEEDEQIRIEERKQEIRSFLNKKPRSRLPSY